MSNLVGLATQVDVVLNALVDTLTPGLGGVADVIDGQPVQQDNRPTLVIGWSPNRIAVEIDQEITDLRGDRRSESLSVVCYAAVSQGETDLRRPRAAVVLILDRVRDILATDRTLAGRVRRAKLGTAMTLDQTSAGGGAAVVEFTIDVDTV